MRKRIIAICMVNSEVQCKFVALVLNNVWLLWKNTFSKFITIITPAANL